jgi:ATP-binding protein involved in chromosome partitioning
MIDEKQVRDLLAKVPYPGFTRDIISFGIVKAITVGSEIKVQLVVSTNDTGVGAKIRSSVEEALAALPGKPPVTVLVDVQAPVQAPVQTSGQGPSSIEGVRRVIAVASGKGGVGKSTVAVNLASAFAAKGLKTAICDCDLYGPSIALMCGTSERPYADEAGKIIPVESHGLKIMSLGLMLEDDSPAILRGPMVTRYTQQFLRDVAWGDLDVLVLDLPPGTGDIQLTIVQTVALSGVVIVTTPQEVALIDARKAVTMFRKTNVPILGVIENMACFIAPDGSRHEIFGSGGGEREAERLKVPFLGSLPLDPAVRIAADAGFPIVLSDPANSTSLKIAEIAGKLS